MSIALSLRAALASALLCVLPSVASATPAEDGPPRPIVVADQCIDKIQRIAARGTDAIRDNSRQTSAQIRWFDRNGADDETLVNAADRGKRQNARRADNARDEINETVRRCIARLELLDAPEQLIERVRSAGQNNRARLRESLSNGNTSINTTLRRALDD